MVVCVVRVLENLTDMGEEDVQLGDAFWACELCDGVMYGHGAAEQGAQLGVAAAQLPGLPAQLGDALTQLRNHGGIHLSSHGMRMLIRTQSGTRAAR